MRISHVELVLRFADIARRLDAAEHALSGTQAAVRMHGSVSLRPHSSRSLSEDVDLLSLRCAWILTQPHTPCSVVPPPPR